jgi:hypothetical protein
VAFTARDRGIESHTVSYSEALDLLTDVLDDPCGFVSHDQRWDTSSGATVKAVNIASTDSACFDLNEQVCWATGRHWHFDDLEFFYFGQQQSLHNFSPFWWLIGRLTVLERWFLGALAYKKLVFSASLLRQGVASFPNLGTRPATL